MGLDMYRKKNIDQINNDSKKCNEINSDVDLKGIPGGLDSDIRQKLLDAKEELLREKRRMEIQEQYDDLEKQLNSDKINSLDYMPDTNSVFKSNATSQQSESTNDDYNISFKKYDSESSEKAKEAIERSLELGQDLLASLEMAINSDLDNEQNLRHR